MSGNGENPGLLAATAHRLRLVQADMADQPIDVRHQCLAEEIERALASVPPDQRPAMLEGLLERFPVWEEAEPIVIEKAIDPPADADALIARLAELAGAMAPAERQALSAKLSEAGLASEAVPAGAPLADDVAASLRKVLGLPPGAAVDPARLARLVVLLAGFAGQMEQVAWTTWRTFAPRSELRRDVEVRRGLAEYLAGQGPADGPAVAQALQGVRGLLAALIGAVGQVSRQFGERHQARLSPAGIEAAVRLEGGSLWTGLDARCWHKYVELAQGLDEAAIQREITEILIAYAEPLLGELKR